MDDLEYQYLYFDRIALNDLIFMEESMEDLPNLTHFFKDVLENNQERKGENHE